MARLDPRCPLRTNCYCLAPRPKEDAVRNRMVGWIQPAPLPRAGLGSRLTGKRFVKAPCVCRRVPANA
eukprot:scaffold213530_cov26-Tisochrysis_lutea.AAC.2